MKKYYSPYVLIFYFLIFMLLFNSCNKPMPVNSVHSYFIKQFPKPGNQYAYFVTQTNDNGFLIIGGQDTLFSYDRVCVVSKTDSTGKLLWTKTIPSFIIADFLFALKQSNGNYFISGFNQDFNNAKMMTINSEGDVSFTKDFASGNWYFNPTLESDNKYYIGISNGWGQYSGSSYIVKFTENGTQKNLLVPDATLKGKVLNLGVYQASEISASETRYWICGQMHYQKPWSWYDKIQFYMARINNSKLEKLVVLDSANVEKSHDIIDAFLGLPDTGLIVAINQSYGVNASTIENPKAFFKLIRYDKELNNLWNKAIRVDGNTSKIKKIISCKSGDFLLAGSSLVSANFEEPLLIKVDRDGNLIWYKVFSGTISGNAFWVDELKDGSIILTGSTNSFGNGNDGSDIFIIKTDASGNIK